jgi:hypothetical protein
MVIALRARSQAGIRVVSSSKAKTGRICRDIAQLNHVGTIWILARETRGWKAVEAEGRLPGSGVIVFSLREQRRFVTESNAEP